MCQAYLPPLLIFNEITSNVSFLNQMTTQKENLITFIHLFLSTKTKLQKTLLSGWLTLPDMFISLLSQNSLQR